VWIVRLGKRFVNFNRIMTCRPREVWISRPPENLESQ